MGATYIARLHSTCSSARQPIRAFSNRATRVCPIHSRPYHINHSLTQHQSQRGGQGEAIFISIVSQAQLSEVRISRNESHSTSPSRVHVTTRVSARGSRPRHHHRPHQLPCRTQHHRRHAEVSPISNYQNLARSQSQSGVTHGRHAALTLVSSAG